MIRLFPLFSFVLAFALPTVLSFCIPPKSLLSRVPHEGESHKKGNCLDKCLVPAANDSPFWMEKIKHQGRSPFNPDPTGYKVFRNVKVCIVVGDIVNETFKFPRILERWGMAFTMTPPR